MAVDRAIRQDEFFCKYVLAVDHALLWIAALSLAAYFHFIVALIITMRNRRIIRRESEKHEI